MILRSAALLALVVSLAASETPLTAEWSFQALGGADLAFLPDRPASATGGVTASYQGLRLAGDRLDYQLVQLPVLSSLTVASAKLSPALTEGSRVALDTRTTDLAQLPVRGLLTPAHLTILRLESPGASVRWQVDLHDLGTAELQLKGSTGWAWHRVWAQEARLRIEAPVEHRTLGAFRLVDATFTGRPEIGDGSGRLAKIDRFAPAPEPPQANEVPVGSVEATEIFLTLDAQDRIAATTRGVTRFQGTGLTDLGSRK